jgi:hypothetical protein
MRLSLPALSAVLLVAALAAGCTDAEKRAFATRCDAPLRDRVETLLRAGTNDSLDVLGTATGTVDEARRAQLAARGASVRMVKAEFFTLRLRASAVAPVASLDFVRGLQLSQTREPLAN